MACWWRVALRCDALLVKITSAQGIRFSGPSLSWPQGQQERREECVMETNETKPNKTKQNEMKCKVFLSFWVKGSASNESGGGRKREGQANAIYTPQKATPLLSVSLARAARSIQNETRRERERESEKGETAKRIPIVKLNACTDNDQSN